jgi:hypothetical protein
MSTPNLLVSDKPMKLSNIFISSCQYSEAPGPDYKGEVLCLISNVQIFFEDMQTISLQLISFCLCIKNSEISSVPTWSSFDLGTNGGMNFSTHSPRANKSLNLSRKPLNVLPVMLRILRRLEQDILRERKEEGKVQMTDKPRGYQNTKPIRNLYLRFT